MGNFAENLNLGNRFQPPPRQMGHFVIHFPPDKGKQEQAVDPFGCP